MRRPISFGHFSRVFWFCPTFVWARIALAWLLCLAAAHAANQQLQIYTEEYPPLTYASQGKPSGLGTAIVEEILRRAGLDAEIEVVPWARAYRSASTQADTGVFLVARTREREALFKWVGPLATARGGLYALRGKSAAVSLAAARQLNSIVVPREWHVHQFLRTEGFDNLSSVLDPATALRMLLAGRTSVVALDDVSLAGTLKAAGVQLSAVELILPLIETELYLGFSQQTADSVIVRCQHALTSMRSDGKLAELYRQWLPGVMPPAVKSHGAASK